MGDVSNRSDYSLPVRTHDGKCKEYHIYDNCIRFRLKLKRSMLTHHHQEKGVINYDRSMDNGVGDGDRK